MASRTKSAWLIAALLVALPSATHAQFKRYSAPKPDPAPLQLPKIDSDCPPSGLTAKQMAIIVTDMAVYHGTPTVIINEHLWKVLPYTRKTSFALSMKCTIEFIAFPDNDKRAKAEKKHIGYIDFRSHLTNRLLAEWRLYKLIIK